METYKAPIAEITANPDEIKNPGYYTEMWNKVYDLLDTDSPNGEIRGVFAVPYKNFNFQTRFYAGKTSLVTFLGAYSSPDIFAHMYIVPFESCRIKLIMKPLSNVKITTTAGVGDNTMFNTILGCQLKNFSLQAGWSYLSGLSGFALYQLNNNIKIGLEAHHNYNSKNFRNSGCVSVQYASPISSLTASLTAGKNLHLYYYRNVNKNVQLGASGLIYTTEKEKLLKCNTTLAAKFSLPRTGTTLHTSVDNFGSFNTNITEPLTPSTSLTFQCLMNPFYDIYKIGLSVRFGPKNDNHFYFTPIIGAMY